MPRGRKASPEQIVVTLRQSEVQLAQGMSLALACKEAGIAEQRAQGRVPERGDLLQLERGSGRGRRVARPLQPSSVALGSRLSASCSCHPRGLCAAPAIPANQAVVSQNSVQNPGQARRACLSQGRVTCTLAQLKHSGQ